MDKVGQVLSCAPECILVAIDSLEVFEGRKEDLQVGRYLQIAQGNNDYTIASIRNLKGTTSTDGSSDINWQFVVECQTVGTLVGGEKFERGSMLLPVPTEPVYVPSKDILDKLFAAGSEYGFPIGELSLNKEILVAINGDKFFSKHIAIAGSTGSGKSCAVSSILQRVVGIVDGKNLNEEKQNNSHIVIFDIHDEYESAFSVEGGSFTLNKLDIDTLQLPYWLMNSEELESIFIESNELNSHNQVSVFRQAVIRNKERHNEEIPEMTYDMPVFFSLEEVRNYIENMNQEVIGRLPGENRPKIKDGTPNGTLLVDKREDYYFDRICNFVPLSTAAANKATNGPFNGEFNRFLSRLEARLSDKRLRFLLDPRKPDGSTYGTADLQEIMKQFLGYLNRANVTIVDLSGIPFEVLSITVSLISRLIFDFCFHYSKLRHSQRALNDVPVMIVCEEAHNYIPQSDQAAYRSSKRSLERIAKEGRKYGLSLMVVSQRPSEVSETILAQCNNFIALRLTNSEDQNYIRRLLPDNSNGVADVLPNLAQGECLVVGDAVPLPCIVQMPRPNPEPHSQSVMVHQEWMQLWRDVSFDEVIARWRKEQDASEAARADAAAAKEP